MIALLFASLLAVADVPPVVVPTARMRPLSNVARWIVDEAVRRSPTVEGLIEELSRYNVIVYVELRMGFMAERGATSIISAPGEWRILRVVLSDRLDPAGRILTLGHELHHVLEIAREAQVRDEASFRELFGRIGYSLGQRAFETDGAIDIEQRIRADLTRKVARGPKPASDPAAGNGRQGKVEI
jgi:hypothetical protein